MTLAAGGTAGRFRQSVPGVPQLVTGKEYLLFLWTGPSGRTQVIGFTQGVFSLPQAEDGSRKAVRELTSETILEPETGNAVLNRIDARFTFRDGKIIRHEDSFDLWKWAGQALGMKGKLTVK